jgi:membrane dipeptidase
MTYLFVDAHEDIAYNIYCFGRNYATSAKQIRFQEQYTETPSRVGEATLGWQDWKQANTVMVCSTIFSMSKRYERGVWEIVGYKNLDEAKKISLSEIDIYRKLEGKFPDKFSIVKNKQQVEPLWQSALKGEEHPIGLVMVMEGTEGIGCPEEIEFWWEQGIRIVGPVWAGGRFCGGTIQRGGFTNEGRRLLSIMAELGMGLDLSHMTEESALEALDRYEGEVIASHVNARSLLRGVDSERHFTDHTIRRLAERGGVMGVVPLNFFLVTNWTKTSPRDKVTINHLADQIDYICQLIGSASHVGIGTDFDGGYGFPEIPFEFNTIADIQKLSNCLANRGYHEADIKKIFGENVKSALERILPE